MLLWIGGRLYHNREREEERATTIGSLCFFYRTDMEQMDSVNMEVKWGLSEKKILWGGRNSITEQLTLGFL